MIDGLKAANPGPLQTDSVAPIWREIMSACRALETPTRVAYLGPAGTFSEEAALGYFGSSIVRVPCASIDEVFRTTTAGAADFGVVPVENSHRRRGRALARPVPAHAAVHHRRDQPVRAPQPAAPRATRWTASGRAARTRRRWRSATPGCPTTCPTPSAGRWRATPKARAWPAWTRRWPPSPASAPAASTACTWWRRRSRTTPHNRTRFAIVTHPQRAPGAAGLGPRLHQPGGVGDQPARAPCTTCWCR